MGRCPECRCRNGHTKICDRRPFNWKTCYHTRVSRNNKCTSCGKPVPQTEENRAKYYKEDRDDDSDSNP